MYAMIDTNPFKWNISPRMAVPDFLARFATLPDGTQGAALPYSCEKILAIMAEHTLVKSYYKTGVSVPWLLQCPRRSCCQFIQDGPHYHPIHHCLEFDDAAKQIFEHTC
jgi:hypothetical protein